MRTVMQQMQSCTLCPRKCRVNRGSEIGVCGQTADIKVARADLHMWEEPCISGRKGSGAVFFSGCALHCVFCQNHNIAAGNAGEVISVERLAEIFLELQEKGANNINLVTAGQFIPQVMEALDMAKGQGLQLPIVYNTSAYEEVDTLRLLEGYVDIYLPDLKYVDSGLSQKYSHATDYFEKASAAIAEMVRQTGELEFVAEKACGRGGKLEDARGRNSNSAGTGSRNSNLAGTGSRNSNSAGIGNGRFGIEEYQRRSEQGESLLMTKGVIVRHLLLPGCSQDSKRVIGYLLKEYGEKIFISIMNQYTPLPHVSAYPELNRKVTPEEYEAVLDFAIESGIENGFMQEGEAASESFIPEFDGKGVLYT